jgi:hypothetical protein
MLYKKQVFFKKGKLITLISKWKTIYIMVWSSYRHNEQKFIIESHIIDKVAPLRWEWYRKVGEFIIKKIKIRTIPPSLSCMCTSSPFFRSHNAVPRRIRLKLSMGKWPLLAINLLKSRTYMWFRINERETFKINGQSGRSTNLWSNMKKLIGINKKKLNGLLLEILILDFFHQFTIKRRKRNWMTALINSNNDWVFEETDLKQLVLNFIRSFIPLLCALIQG